MPSPIKVGIIGYGFSARTFHIPFIKSNPDLVIHSFLQRGDVPHVRGSPASSCEDDFPSAKRYRTADSFFDDKETELVIITTGHASHAELAEKALKAGMNVVVEKPFTATSEEADRLIDLHRQTSKVLTVFQSRRYDSDFRTLQRVLSAGHIGDVKECELHFDWDIMFDGLGSTPYAPGDGLMFGLGSHTVDQALIMFGRPSSVTGFYRALPGGTSTTDVWFTIILQYSGNTSDLFVTIKSMMNSMMKPNMKYFVRGSEGSFIKFGWDPQEEQLIAGVSNTDEAYGREGADIHGTLTTTRRMLDSQMPNGNLWTGKVPSVKGDIGDFYRDVVAAVRGESAVVVQPQQSRDGIRIIELARKSSETGQTLPFE